MPIPSPIPPVLVGVSPDLRTTSATVDMIVGDQVRKVDGNAMGIWIQHRIFITILNGDSPVIVGKMTMDYNIL